MYIPESEYKLIQAKLPILCVDLLIMNNEKCLLLKRDNEPAKGEYWFPGGRVFKLETIKDAAIRKAREEVNLHCEFHHIVSIEETIFEKKEKMTTDIHTINVVCKLTAAKINEIKLDTLHNNFIWVSFEEIVGLNLHPALLKPMEIEHNRSTNRILL